MPPTGKSPSSGNRRRLGTLRSVEKIKDAA
jgi:hypothetical protein